MPGAEAIEFAPTSLLLGHSEVELVLQRPRHNLDTSLVTCDQQRVLFVLAVATKAGLLPSEKAARDE